ncbi:LppU/SCO3897 family protein [Micromonospora andamanensis]|uniref:LppU/SCO3897 family protein n=1 Tax=Micromonospora andamanensis TaxID=1287068 RepID=UPI00194F29F0|nr:hypothetical protein [Micromonospora andamanensis]GIJ41369.1 hypothetical protein Vwe01_46940 [Micromonospora andamanensis]
MTSEGPHRPGQEPDEVPPGGGGPAPYGDRPAQPDNGYGASAPDLGWAPPPPARPDPSAPAWANQQGNAWGSAQATRQAEAATPGSWDQPAGNQPAWASQGDQPPQPAPGWAPAGSPTSDQPAWANGAQTGPAWATDPPNGDTARPAQPATSQPDWAANQPAASQPDWAGGQPAPAQSNVAASGGWSAGQQPDWAQAPRTDDPAPGWASTAGQPEPAQPAWAQADQPPPAREPAARASAQVPAPDAGQQQRPADGSSRAEAWPTEQPEQPGWATGQRREPAAGAWANEQAVEGWHAGGDRPAQPDWATPAREEPTGWAGGNPAAGPPPSWSPSAEPLPSRTAADRSPSPDIQPWAAGEAWGQAAAEPAAPRPSPEPDAARPDDAPAYQPAPAPGISPANMVPLPPQEQRVPGASLAATPPADFAQPTPFTDDQAGSAGRPVADQPAGGMAWGQPEPRHDDPQPPAIPAPRTSPEAEGRVTPPAGGGVAASASVPLSSRVMPPADHPVRPAGSPTPQPRVYGRPARPEHTEEPAQEHGEQPLVPRFDQSPGRFDFDQAAERGDQGPERFEQAPEPRFDPPMGGPNAFAGPAAPASPAAPPAFPPGMPSFMDAPPTNRPVNGVRPHAEPERPADPFGGGPRDPFGGPGGDPFGGPSDRPGGAYGSPVRSEPGSEHNSAFPPPPQSAPPWSPGPGSGSGESEQGRFDAFKPVAEPAPETPTPKVRNGRVLAAVLVAAVLILAIPLGLLMLLGMIGGSDDANAFDPPVGSCVKRSGTTAVAAECTEPEAFSVVSKVESKDKCPDPAMPHVDLRGATANPVLCLKEATGG